MASTAGVPEERSAIRGPGLRWSWGVSLNRHRIWSGKKKSAWPTDPACGRLEAQQEQEEDTRGATPCSGSA
jgi:hypothetical protein